MNKFTRIISFSACGVSAVMDATKQANDWIKKIEKRHVISITHMTTCHIAEDYEYNITMVVEGEVHTNLQPLSYATDRLLLELLGEAA